MIALPDRRKSVRNPSLDNALIRFGELSLCCVVRDITERGAALNADDPPSPVPDQFTLIVPPNKTYSCNVVWREGDWVGVAFVV
ncbi:PilZ domain-containing protein [Bradyrhizobium tropiciagri]|uniref:PilZ domain-containing protein n=1 Tax=Bradyrhizobium tropiciagri TaxID=312253 RepID=UPI001BA44B04|nr:PilZ domain-containing protein [Bradyrhizobium tropiciagri]MBR0900076.1 PilZ domain-containing protein [Bradyrhizobium tropiciagri]